MKFGLVLTSAAILAVAGVVSGCRDSGSPLEGSAEVQTAPADTSVAVAESDSISVAEREVPLASDVSASQEIGPDGGTLRLEEAGLTLRFAPGAVSTPVVITTRMLAGNYVVFTCEPHGLVFAAPVMAQVDLKKLGLNKGQLNSGHYQTGYIESPGAVNVTGRTRAHERLPVELQLFGRHATFRMPHFSTLALASGTYRRTN